MKPDSPLLALEHVPATGALPPQYGCVRLVCLSDTHNKHRQIQVPPGDILIHSGDFTNTGTLAEVKEFDAWLGTLPHTHKVVVPGNHDSVMDPYIRKLVQAGGLSMYDSEEVDEWERISKNDNLLENAQVLLNRSVELAGLSIYGSPHTIFNGELARRNQNHYAYSFGSTQESMIEQHLSCVEYCDILVTHSPPLGVADVTRTKHRGSQAVRDTVLRINPALHMFGHVHPHGGNAFKLQDTPENRAQLSCDRYSDRWWEQGKTTFVNAASLTVIGCAEYKNTSVPAGFLRHPVVLDIDTSTKQVHYRE